MPAEKKRSIMKIEKQKNALSEKWMNNFNVESYRKQPNINTYEVRTMDNIGVLEDQVRKPPN